MRWAALLFTLALILLTEGLSFAALPSPPSGVSYITHYPGDSVSTSYAHIYVWYDEIGNLYIHFDPKGIYNLTYGNPSFYDPNSGQYIPTVLENQYNDDWGIYYAIDEAETFYLHSTSSSIPFPSNTETTTLMFAVTGIGSPYIASWPSDFNAGQTYPEDCECDDEDRDGVPDAWDQCEDTSSTALVDEYGCPQAEGRITIIPLFK